MTPLPQLRIRLAEAQAELRTAKDQEATAKVVATMSTTGSNAEERKKADALALHTSQSYQAALTDLRIRETIVDRIQAEIDAAKDERTAEELRIRDHANVATERLAAAYERMARSHPVATTLDAQLPF